ncbi:MAG: thioredoxin fold domain-containing protein [Rhodospirillales bacterium]|nr:thioredoxin fold domain-containing protein [Rhodospirillales bacterium]
MLGGPAAVPATAQDATVQKAAARIEPVVLEDGRYTQAWFLNSFLILREDIADAAKQGKRLAIIWDQRGCPYCMEMQRVNFGDPVVNSYVRERFTIIQLDLFGSREVTDFDGAVMTEKEMARKYGISFTPTIQFFPETPEQLVGKVGRASEVARMPGYFKPGHFEAMFEYVHAKAYEQLPFARFLQARSDKKS